MKKCHICCIEKSISEFNKNKCRKDGLQTMCKSCSRDRSKKYYREHPENHKKAVGERNKIKRKEFIEFTAKIKSFVGCLVCGEGNAICLDFHHIGDKKYNISNAIFNSMVGKNALKNEIKKCIVVCSNCHRKIHAKFVKLDSDLVRTGMQVLRKAFDAELAAAPDF